MIFTPRKEHIVVYRVVNIHSKAYIFPCSPRGAVDMDDLIPESAKLYEQCLNGVVDEEQVYIDHVYKIVIGAMIGDSIDWCEPHNQQE